MSPVSSAKYAGATGRVVACFAQIDTDQQQVFRGIAEVRALEVVRRPSQQAGDDEQRQGERQLQAHEKPAGALLTQTPDGAPALFHEAGSDLNLRDLAGREHAEQQRRRKRRQQDED